MSASDHGIVWALGPSPPLTSNTVSWLTFDASAVAGTDVDENESDEEPTMEESEEEPKKEEPEEDSKTKESSEKSKMADHLRITIAQ